MQSAGVRIAEITVAVQVTVSIILCLIAWRIALRVIFKDISARGRLPAIAHFH